jgi:hypothetical protein
MAISRLTGAGCSEVCMGFDNAFVRGCPSALRFLGVAVDIFSLCFRLLFRHLSQINETT